MKYFIVTAIWKDGYERTWLYQCHTNHIAMEWAKYRLMGWEDKIAGYFVSAMYEEKGN